MRDYAFEPPYNSRMWSDMIDSGAMVPNTEDREFIRIPAAVHKALIQIRHLSERESLTDIVSLGLYYAKDSIRRTYEIDWDEFEDWYAEQLAKTATWESWGNELQPVSFEYQQSLNKVVAVRPKGRDLPWIEQFGRLCHLHEQDDVLRLLLYYAITMYSWETYAGEQWTRWVETPRRAVWELEQVIQDRRDRMNDGH